VLHEAELQCSIGTTRLNYGTGTAILKCPVQAGFSVTFPAPSMDKTKCPPAIATEQLMHIPDGFLSTEVCAVTTALSLGAVGYSLHKLKDSLADRTVPMTGMMAALIFAGQMVNFPLIGTSGHLIGGVLAAVILGPWAGCLALTLVLFVQCLLFGDGGIVALGTNILHMGVVGAIGGYAIYATIRRFARNTGTGTIVAAVVASWITVMAGAALFCLEFRLSQSADDFEFLNAFTLMVTVHSAIGIGEALITGVIVSLVLKQRPDLVYEPESEGNRVVGLQRVFAAGVVVALAVAAFLAPFASSLPDGLESVAMRTGIEQLNKRANHSLLSDYDIPIATESWPMLSVSLAGIVGTGSVLVIALLLGRAFRLRPSFVDATSGE